MKIKHLYDKLFTVDYVLAYNIKSNKDIDTLCVKLSKIFKDKIKLEYLEGAQGYCSEIQTKNGLVIVIVLETFDHSSESLGVLAHECFHATAFTMAHKGIKLSEETEEVYAYNIGMLVSEFLEKQKNPRSTTMKKKAIKNNLIKIDFKKIYSKLYDGK